MSLTCLDSFPSESLPPQNLNGYLVLLVVAVAIRDIARWVYRDATARGSEWARQWAFLTTVALFAALVPGVVVLALSSWV